MLARVLLVEHDATAGGELEAGLRAHGCDVTLLSDGQSVPARVANDRFDVILVSGELPGRSSADDIVLFKSNGLAAWDVAIGARAIELAVKKKVGRKV